MRPEDSLSAFPENVMGPQVPGGPEVGEGGTSGQTTCGSCSPFGTFLALLSTFSRIQYPAGDRGAQRQRTGLDFGISTFPSWDLKQCILPLGGWSFLLSKISRVRGASQTA